MIWLLVAWLYLSGAMATSCAAFFGVRGFSFHLWGVTLVVLWPIAWPIVFVASIIEEVRR